MGKQHLLGRNHSFHCLWNNTEKLHFESRPTFKFFFFIYVGKIFASKSAKAKYLTSKNYNNKYNDYLYDCKKYKAADGW